MKRVGTLSRTNTMINSFNTYYITPFWKMCLALQRPLILYLIFEMRERKRESSSGQHLRLPNISFILKSPGAPESQSPEVAPLVHITTIFNI
jgi:hypothetical protein